MIVQPASRLLRLALERIEADLNRSVAEAAEAEREALGIPAAARFNVERLAWEIPTVDPEPQGNGDAGQ